MVETPGATSALTVSSTWRTICPLRRILPSSEFDLQLIMHSCRCGPAFDGAKNLRHYLFYRKLAIHPEQTALLTIIINQGYRLAFIVSQTLRDNFFLVVLALHQCGAAEIANAFFLGRLEVDIVNLAVDRTATAAGKPLQ